MGSGFHGGILQGETVSKPISFALNISYIYYCSMDQTGLQLPDVMLYYVMLYFIQKK